MFTLVFLVYRWHIGRPNIDNYPLEIFFILSGFVIAYRYFKRDEPFSLSVSVKFVFKRIAKIYPIHLLVLAASIILQRWYQIHGQLELGFGTLSEFAKKLLLSLTLTQSWAFSEEYHFCMNGVVWFLSALVFFYALTPLLLTLFRRMPHSSFLLAIIAICSVLYSHIPGWMGDYYYSTCPLLYLPLYTQGMAMGSIYSDLLENEFFANAKTARGCMALIFVGYYIVYIYAPPQFKPVWPFAYGSVDIPLLMLVFGLAQDIGPVRILGNPVIRFFADRSMEIYISHQVWLLYVDAIREFLLNHQIYRMSAAKREIFRIIGLFIITEILHTVVPLVLTAIKKKIAKQSSVNAENI